jgi:hypothetical protein
MSSDEAKTLALLGLTKAELQERVVARLCADVTTVTREGYAVLLEEVDELWEEVRKGGTEPRDLDRMRKEAVQVGAMALRFLHNVCGVTGVRS